MKPKDAYKKHDYSGKRPSKKKSKLMFQRWNRENTSRIKEWRKENTRPELGPSTNTDNFVMAQTRQGQKKVIKTYSKDRCALGPLPLNESQDFNKEIETLSSRSAEKESRPPPQSPDPEPMEIEWPEDPDTEGHTLNIEAVGSNDLKLEGLEGYRVVDIQHVLSWSLQIQKKHSLECTCCDIKYVGEKKDGLRSEFIFKCDQCEKLMTHTSEKNHKANKALVWGALTGGSYYAQANHLLSAMDIPTMSDKSFRSVENDLGKVWEEHLCEEMKEAGKKEREIAIEKGNVSEDGVPFIMVYVDGGWSKRSYGHNFNASSGTACIIGAETKKCLFLGVKNKYCSVCAYNEKNEKENEHTCFKNYSGSSSGMETEILVEGFTKSIEMHGVRFTSFVGDGDSSVFARLTQKVPYGNMITKKECKNHVLKNYTGSLYKIANDTKMPLEARKILSSKIHKLTTVARMQMKQSNAQKMRQDLQNGPSHVFGDHDKCDKYYCRYVDEENTELEKDENLVPTLKKHILLWAGIETAIANMSRKADRLVGDVTNNVAENFMSLMAKFNCGKRLNLTQRGSYNRRAHIAGLCQISGQKWHHKAWKRASNHKPGPFFKKYLQQSKKTALRRAARTRKITRKKNPKCAGRKPDRDYGPEAVDAAIEIPEEELKELCAKKLQELQVDDLDEINDIQEKTVGQHGNALFDELRKNRLTASQFGLICKRRRGTSCHNHVKAVLYKNCFSSSDTAYGQKYEKVAIRKFEVACNKKVIPSGLFIDPQHGFLGASPDGIVVGESALVEVKTFPSLARAGLTLQEAAETKKNFCLNLVDGQLQLKTNHNFYSQIQGQIHVARKESCYLVLFISNEERMTVISIQKDSEFIINMLQKLQEFYVACILPEIILRRIPNNHRCREPKTICHTDQIDGSIDQTGEQTDQTDGRLDQTGEQTDHADGRPHQTYGRTDKPDIH